MQAGWTESLGYITVTFDTPVEHEPTEDCLDYFSSSSYTLFGDGA